MDAVVILSGGMDSTTLLYNVIKHYNKVYAISFNYGQRHSKELECAKSTCKKLDVPHKILDISCLNEIAPSALTRSDIDVPEGHYEDESMKKTVVPNRNMVFISLAVSYAIGLDVDVVLYGAHSGDHAIYPDCRPPFVETMVNAVTFASDDKVYFETPYLHSTKGDIVKYGIKLGVDYSLTWTCYKGGEKACGKCGSCIERLEAFAENGIEDPIEYE